MNEQLEMRRKLRQMIDKAEVKNAQSYPPEAKFLLIIFTTGSVHIPGDERSRTNPGHGYPAHNHEYTSFTMHAYEDEDNLKEHIQLLIDEDQKRKDYLILKVNGTIGVGMTLNLKT